MVLDVRLSDSFAIRLKLPCSPYGLHSQPGNRLEFMSRCQIEQITGGGDLDTYKRKLTTVLARLASSYCEVTLERDFASPTCDSVNQLALDSERNPMLRRLEWMSLLTRQVSEALERIYNGSYGICLRCGQPIASKRMAALPWVAFCAACQEEKADTRGHKRDQGKKNDELKTVGNHPCRR
jgi:DnaK suppressor protein